VNLFLKPKRITRLLGRDSGLKGWALAVVLGILSTGPIYAWYPLLADLKEKGMRESLLSAFLYNRAVKLPLLPMMIAYFGIGFTAVLTALMVAGSVLGGLLLERLLRGGETRE
jgi:uncharacterized membrane protein YraQ (UPF0718 family)